MGHMKPEFYHGTFQRVSDTPEGDILHPEESAPYPDNDTAAEVYGVTIEDVSTESGWGFRLSAPGFMDCTDWSGCYDTLSEAIHEFLGMYGDGLDEDTETLDCLCNLVDGFDELWDSYCVTMAFCCSGGEHGDNAPDWQYSGEFSEDPDEIRETIALPDQLNEARAECLDFWTQAVKYIARDQMADLGGDFHYTRNGHGVGFWDSSRWPKFSDELDQLATPYGTSQLSWYGGNNGTPIEFDIHG